MRSAIVTVLLTATMVCAQARISINGPARSGAVDRVVNGPARSGAVDRVVGFMSIDLDGLPANHRN